MPNGTNGKSLPQFCQESTGADVCNVFTLHQNIRTPSTCVDANNSCFQTKAINSQANSNSNSPVYVISGQRNLNLYHNRELNANQTSYNRNIIPTCMSNSSSNHNNEIFQNNSNQMSFVSYAPSASHYAPLTSSDVNTNFSIPTAGLHCYSRQPPDYRQPGNMSVYQCYNNPLVLAHSLPYQNQQHSYPLHTDTRKGPEEMARQKFTAILPNSQQQTFEKALPNSLYSTELDKSRNHSPKTNNMLRINAYTTRGDESAGSYDQQMIPSLFRIRAPGCESINMGMRLPLVIGNNTKPTTPQLAVSTTCPNNSSVSSSSLVTIQHDTDATVSITSSHSNAGSLNANYSTSILCTPSITTATRSDPTTLGSNTALQTDNGYIVDMKTLTENNVSIIAETEIHPDRSVIRSCILPNFLDISNISDDMEVINDAKPDVDNQQEFFKCGPCKVSFDAEFSLLAHLLEQHSNDSTVACAHCGKLVEKMTLFQHLTREHRSYGSRSIVCGGKTSGWSCAYVASCPDDVAKHMTMNHSEEGSVFKCYRCHFTCHTVEDYIAHCKEGSHDVKIPDVNVSRAKRQQVIMGCSSDDDSQDVSYRHSSFEDQISQDTCTNSQGTRDNILQDCIPQNKISQDIPAHNTYLQGVHQNDTSSNSICDVDRPTKNKHLPTSIGVNLTSEKIEDDEQERFNSTDIICYYCNQTKTSAQTMMRHIRANHSDEEMLWMDASAKYTYNETDGAVIVTSVPFPSQRLPNNRQSRKRRYRKLSHSASPACVARKPTNWNATPAGFQDESKQNEETRLTYCCHECPFSTKSMLHFQLHVGEHNSIKEKCMRVDPKMYYKQCGICGYLATVEDDFKKHDEMHLFQKEFLCLYCQMDFTTKHKIMAHLKVAHPEQNQELYLDRGSLYSVMLRQPKLMASMETKVVIKKTPNIDKKKRITMLPLFL